MPARGWARRRRASRAGAAVLRWAANCPDNFDAIQRCSCAMFSTMPTATSLPHPLPAPLVELIADRFRFLSEPIRIGLLDALREGEVTVAGCEQATGGTQQNVSKHLGVRLRAGIGAGRKAGNFSVSSIVDEAIFSLCEEVWGNLHRQVAELDALLKGG